MAFGGLIDQVQGILGGKDYDKAMQDVREMTAMGQAALDPYASMGERGREEMDKFYADPMADESFRSTYEHQTKLARQRLLAGGKGTTRLMGEQAAGIFAKVHELIAGQISQPLSVAAGAASAQSQGLMGAASMITDIGVAKGSLMNNLLTAGMGSAAMASSGAIGQGGYQAGYNAAYSGAVNAQADVYGARYTGWT